MKISPQIRKYKKTVDSFSVLELSTVFNNSRLSVDERFALELVDLYLKPNKEAALIMKTDERQLGRWLHSGRKKVIKQIFKKP